MRRLASCDADRQPIDRYIWVNIASTYQQTGYLQKYGQSFNDDDIQKSRQPAMMRHGNGLVGLVPQMTLVDTRDGKTHEPPPQPDARSAPYRRQQAGLNGGPSPPAFTDDDTALIVSTFHALELGPIVTKM